MRLHEIDWALKILIDARPELNLIATGSASFVLAGQVGEPLTGRQTPLMLFPVATSELAGRHNAHELRAGLDNFLVYGMYPEVRAATSDRDRRDIVLEATRSYLFKDILELERIKSTQKLVDLHTLVALQVGNLVSLSELGAQVGLDTKTVARYLGLLEQCHALFNLRGFSRNLRSEITKTSKWYFFDVGVRNALLNNFNPPGQRDDIGALWENFMVLERRKALAYAGAESPLYFWRTWEQQEIDLLEDRDGTLHAYEFKWNPHAKVRRPARFLETYPDANFTVVTPETFGDALQV
jgi:predicted AAA+ superfamily ATPase